MIKNLLKINPCSLNRVIVEARIKSAFRPDAEDAKHLNCEQHAASG